MTTFIGIVLIVAAVFLVVAVLLQSGKDKGLSGTIGGANSADTYYGKNKGNSKDYILNKLTTVVAVVFALLVVVSFVLQDENEMKTSYEDFKNNLTQTESSAESSTEGTGSADGEGTSEAEGSNEA